jgi:3-hydroxybutyryl-CoA dehydratase
MQSNKWVDPFVRRFEDFEVGAECITRGRTVDIGDISLFAGLTGDHYPLHTDAQFAEGTQFGERISHGPFTFTIAVGLIGMTGWYGDAVLGFLGVDNMRAKLPVKAGDTLHVEAVVLEAVMNTSGRSGAVTIAYHVINQRDEEVFYFEQKNLMRTRATDTQEEK